MKQPSLNFSNINLKNRLPKVLLPKSFTRKPQKWLSTGAALEIDVEICGGKRLALVAAFAERAREMNAELGDVVAPHF